jgi:hypothetical protein
MLIRPVLNPLLALWLALCSGLALAQPVPFGLFGDTPYSAWERATLPVLMAEMAQTQPAFVVHVGDFKSGSEPCSDALFQDRLALFQSAPMALVFVPGDNDWTDCHRRSNGAYDPLERLDRLRDWFFVGDQSLGQRPLPLLRQSTDPALARYRENVRWEAGGALFVALNLPGSDNNFYGVPGQTGPVPEFVARSAANQAWLAQAFAHAREQGLAGVLILIQANPGFEAARAGRSQLGYDAFLAQLRQEAARFAGPVVLVHGDTHRQRIDQPLTDLASGAPVRNLTRVETFGWPFFGWVLGTVDTRDPQVFRFEARPWRTPAPDR